MKSEKVITRFPPSPTGAFHIGSARTALFNYLFARHAEGAFYMRFEDTDRERSKKEFEQDILDGLAWLGLSYENKEVPRQSQHSGVYKEHLLQMIKSGAAYEAEAGTENPGKKVIRFKNPGTKITFDDLVRGEVSFDTTELGDFVIAKNLDEPLYHLAVVIDDFKTGVTHVIRGEDHISNTPRQILILEALGFPRPRYAHIPLILAPDRTKLSKRHGATALGQYRALGYIPEAIINYLALLGWNPGGEKELFSLKELVELFAVERVHKSGAIFDIEKLKWFNHEHLKRLSDAEFLRRLSAFVEKEPDLRLAPLLKDRSRTLKEAAEALASGEFDFLDHAAVPDPALLTKGAKAGAEAVKKNLTEVLGLLKNISDEAFTAETIKEAVFPYATAQGRASVLWPMRTALSGKEKSPDPFVLAHLLGKEKTTGRIEAALKML